MIGYTTGAELSKVGKTGIKRVTSYTLEEVLNKVYEIIPSSTKGATLSIPRCLWARKFKIVLVK